MICIAPMQLPSELFSRFETINWFSKCATGSNPALGWDIIWVRDWRTAAESLSHPNWEDTTLHARNALTTHLAARDQSAYQKWNVLMKEARQRIGTEVMPIVEQFQQEHSLSEMFSQCVRWDLLGAVMEATYKRFRPPVFFDRLLTIYERGRFPCGWKGEWPNGKLMVI